MQTLRRTPPWSVPATSRNRPLWSALGWLLLGLWWAFSVWAGLSLTVTLGILVPFAFAGLALRRLESTALSSRKAGGAQAARHT